MADRFPNLPNGRQLWAEREAIDVTTSGPQPNKAWRYTDRAGHKHYWQDGYPTLREVKGEPYWCDDCRDDHVDTFLRCRLCNEVITPGMTSSLWRERIGGPVQWFLDGELISEARARAILNGDLDA